MLKNHLFGAIMLFVLGQLAACSTPSPYKPEAGQTQPVDLSSYSQQVNTFVVLLDTSGSMKEEYGDRSKIHEAQDLLASFNRAVPPANFQAALVTYGRGSISCVGYGSVSTLYGLQSHQSAEFADALGAIRCAASTTPIAEALGTTTELLADDTGNIAVFIFSDFKWRDMGPVNDALAELRGQRGDRLCVHTVKLGDRTASDQVISSITSSGSCNSSVSAADIASAEAMTAYVANTLMAPSAVTYEKRVLSALALFDFDKAILKEDSKAELRELGSYIRSKGLSVADIDIIGHTDNIGEEAYNKELSLARAMAVKSFIVDAGVDASIIDVEGRGAAEPIASNASDDGRAQNRRVEMLIGTVPSQ